MDFATRLALGIIGRLLSGFIWRHRALKLIKMGSYEGCRNIQALELSEPEGLSPELNRELTKSALEKLANELDFEARWASDHGDYQRAVTASELRDYCRRSI